MKPLLTIRVTINRPGAKPELWEVDAEQPENLTPQNLAASIDDAFRAIRKTVAEQLESTGN